MNNLEGFQNSNNVSGEIEGIDFKKIFTKLVSKWLWFVASIIVCIIFAFFYVKVTAPLYQINAQLLVNGSDKSSGGGGQASALMDLGGLVGSKSSVENEVEIIKTRFLMEQVVREMKLNILYYTKTTFARRELYKPPFKITIIRGLDTIVNTEINVKKISNSKIRVSKSNFSKDVNWGESFDLKGVGQVSLSAESGLLMTNVDYVVSILSIDERVSDLMQQLLVDTKNIKVTIMSLGLKYPLPKKGEDILNTLIDRYIKANLSDKNAIADSTDKFIKERLSIISAELGSVEDKVESFKEKNQLADMSEQGKLLVQNTSEFGAELAKAETQVAIISDLEKYLQDSAKNKRVFPTSLLPSDMVFSGLMSQYNSLLVERDRLLLSDTQESPFVKNLDDQIKGLRSGILANIQSTKNSFVVTRNKLRNQLNEADSRIQGVPQIEKNYLKLARNKEIKQELYVFLMQKAEETAISKTANLPVAKVIDPPKAAIWPISPKKGMTYVVALFLGLMIPLGVIGMLQMLDTAIGTKEDIINLTSVPIVGEINHNNSSDNLIVANHNRSAISEQFRALRTNLSFYLKKPMGNVVLLTSSMSGEGKSFTAINLANILALSGRKVLLMELDLRKPGLSAKLGIDNNIGFSNFTIDANIKIHDIIKPLQINNNMFIISSGPLPPNPAETLISEHMPALMEMLKREFDYIIMDAPPIGIIADAQLLAPYADATLYLVRQKITRKDQMAIVEELNRSRKMSNIGIIVNDINGKEYGYGYGYGNYGVNEEKSVWKNFFKRSRSN